MDDLITFLRARLDEDERIAQTCTPGHERWQGFSMDDIAGVSVYDDQWRLLSGTWYDHNNPMSSDPSRTGPAYIDTDQIMQHVARHDPARVLADVAAKRAILEEHDAYEDYAGVWCRGCGYGPQGAYVMPHDECPTLRLLASVYADHPDFQEAWRP